MLNYLLHRINIVLLLLTYNTTLISNKNASLKKIKLLFLFILGISIGANAQISGTVFNDVNRNGIKDATENGYPFVVVNAYAPNNATPVATTTTSATTLGTYTLTGLTSGVTYRIEFSNFSGLYPAPFGSSSKSSVQFTVSGSTNVDFGVQIPNKCLLSNNPRMVAGLGVVTNNFKVMSWRYQDRSTIASNSSSITTGVVNDFNDKGVPVALTSDSKKKLIYFTTINSDLTSVFPQTPQTLTGIYVASYSGANFSYTSSKLLVDLATLSISTNNTYPFPPLGTNDKSNINKYFGISGLCGIQVTNDGNTLYAINAGNGKLIKLNISNVNYASLPTTAPTTADVSEIVIPSSIPNATNGRFRPNSLNMKGDILYIGGVNDAMNVTSNIDNNPADLQLVVLSYDTKTGTFAKVFSSGTNFTCGDIFNDGNNQVRWSNINYSEHVLFGNYGYRKEIQPYMSDFDFDDKGNLIMGIANRTMYEIGSDLGMAGYIIKASLNSNGTYTLESNGVAGTETTAVPNSIASQSSSDGPGTNWFFHQSMLEHIYTFSGGVYVLPGSGEVLAGHADPIYYNSSGARYFKANNGTRVYGTNLTDDKTFALTGIEAVCDASPVEIGNLVWKDSNNNGIQDPNEPALVGVTVCLLDNTGNQISSAVTDASGNYIFSSAAGTSSGSRIYGLSLTNTANYSLKICSLGSDASVAGLSLTDLTTTVGETSGQTNSGSTLSNSDAFLVSGSPVIALKMGAPGENNHTYDFGFNASVVTCSSSVTATPGTCNSTTNQYTLTGTITLTNPPSTGTITVQIVGGGSQTINLPQASPISYSISAQNSDGASHTVDVSISGVGCASSTTYNAPAACQVGACSSTVTATPGACNSTTNQYTLTGTITLTNPPSTGTITVQIVGGGSQTINLPQTSPISYSISAQNSDGASHTVNVSISGVSCASTVNYTAPVSCSVSSCPFPNCNVLKSKRVINN